MPNPHTAAILNYLWPPGHRHWIKICAVLDGARDERIFRAINKTNLEKFCLYAGRLPFAIQEVAPYLVVLQREDQLTRLLLEEGWGQSWGIFVRTETPIPTLRRHLRTFLKVKDEAGRRMIFRWYDPRVMRFYLPTCIPDELRLLFGPVDNYCMESQLSSLMLDYRFENGRLIESPHDLASTMPALDH